MTDKPLDLRTEAVELLERLARQETDPGGRGYAEGMAQRLRANPREVVTEEYVAGLREAVA